MTTQDALDAARRAAAADPIAPPAWMWGRSDSAELLAAWSAVALARGATIHGPPFDRPEFCPGCCCDVKMFPVIMAHPGILNAADRASSNWSPHNHDPGDEDRS